MLYAILGDIHSNLEALSAVLKDLEDNKVDKIFSVGDIVGYGADPSLCLKAALQNFQLITAGNHDWAVGGRLELEWFNEKARQALIWTQKALSQSEKALLFDLSLIAEYQDMIFVHSSLYEPEQFHYILNSSQAHRNFGYQKDKNICFIGHSHIPFFVSFNSLNSELNIFKKSELKIEKAKKYLINVGSVGQPRDGDSRACYVLYDEAEAFVKIKRVEYNVSQACSKIISSGLPRKFGERLYYGR